MSSNIVAGERRWSSARKGGMTVLGKVVVPKPLNLPSQRLENHGLDPNVEIVPKGTLSWGSRPSSSGSNPWTSQSLVADGGSSSPGPLGGRPSSGGSGTRPSSSGSDKPHDAVTSALASRPTSASGTMSSNHTSSTPLRPRTGENRPTSSHLSRFADSKNSMAWGPSMAAEKMGVKSMNGDGFSLSSGDFPDLGSEKGNLVKNNESEGHIRPRSASGRIDKAREDIHADVNQGGLRTWNADGFASAEDDKHPVSGKRQVEPTQYFNASAPPQHFDAWRGPPMSGPGVWYGGHPRGPAVGVPNISGGFPVDAFPYYHPQMPPPPIATSHQVPPGAGPRTHPKGGDLFRAQMPDAYARPNMPVRPGFYPGPRGPPVFESYYGPPLGYSSKEQDIPPHMGIALGRPVYNGFGGPGADNGRPAARAPVLASADQIDTGHPVHNQAPRGALAENHNERKLGDAESNFNVSNSGRKHPLIFSRKNEWGAEEEPEEVLDTKRAPGEISSDDKYAVPMMHGGMKKLYGGTQRPLTSEKDSSFATGMKNSALIHKIDSLNAKARFSDGPSNYSSAPNREEESHGSPVVERRHLPKDVSSPLHGTKASFGHMSEPTVVLSRKSRPSSSESQTAVTDSSRKLGSAPDVNLPSINSPVKDGLDAVIYQPGSEDLIEPNVPTDVQAQRIKMRELAKQRALQLQKEEEERMREQRAKALAKLEELNRRSLPSGSACQKVEAEKVICDNETPGEMNTCPESVIAGANCLEFAEDKILNQDENAVDPTSRENLGGNESSVGQASCENLDEEFVESPLNVQKVSSLEPLVSPVKTFVESEDGVPNQKVPESGQVGTPSHPEKTQLESNSSQESVIEKSVPVVSDAEKDDKNAAAAADALLDENQSSETNLAKSDAAKTLKAVSVPSAHPRKRNNRNGKYKHKSDEVPPAPASGEAIPAMDPGEYLNENAELKNPLPDSQSHVLKVDDTDKEVPAQEGLSSMPSEESERKELSNQWKPHSRKFSRSQQGNRFVDKLHSNDNVMWAPVRTQSKDKVNAEANQKSAEDSASSTKDDGATQNTPKSKRAELERYVPKPVAMELAQQVGNQTLSSTVSSRSVEDTQKEQTVQFTFGSLPIRSSSTFVASGLDNVEGEGKQPGKLKKYSVTWRQRSSNGSPDTNISTSDTDKNLQQPKGPVENDLHPSSHEIKSSSGVVSNDGNVIASGAAPALGKNPSVKAQGLANRGKKQIPRGSRSSGNEVDENVVQFSAPDGNQTEKENFSRENRNFGEQRMPSRWQPKTQPNPTNEQRRDQGSGSEPTAEVVNKHPRKGYQHQHKVQPERRQVTESSNVEGNSADVNVGLPQESDQEKRPSSAKGRAHSSTRNPEPVPTSGKDGHLRERNFYSGFRGNARQNSRPFRNHDYRGDWPSTQEMQRQNVHSEYQPVGNRTDMAEEHVVESVPSQRQGRKQGQNNFRRAGNYYRRQSSSTAAVDVGGAD